MTVDQEEGKVMRTSQLVSFEMIGPSKALLANITLVSRLSFGMCIHVARLSIMSGRYEVEAGVSTTVGVMILAGVRRGTTL